MSGVRRSQKTKPEGLVFSSNTTKRKIDNIPHLELTAKRSHTTEIPSLITSPKGVKTRFLIISDTHGKSALPQKITTDIDVVLHCGDLSEYGSLSDYENSIALLASVGAPLKLVIPGNHDLSLDTKFWAENSTESGRALSDQVRDLWADAAATSNIHMLSNGLHRFVLASGAVLRLFASISTANWAFGYNSAEDIHNPAGTGIVYGQNTDRVDTPRIEENAQIDIVMTHGPAKYRLDKALDNSNIGCPHLFRALRRNQPKLHCFGHVHSAYGAELVRWIGKPSQLPEDDHGADDGILVTANVGGAYVEDVRRVERLGEMENVTIIVNTTLIGPPKTRRTPRNSRSPRITLVT